MNATIISASKGIKLTLINSFHGTTRVINVPDASVCRTERGVEEHETWSRFRDHLTMQSDRGDNAAKQRLRRIENNLCGIKGCQCGTVRW